MSSSPTLEFNYDISCPFAYIASTRVAALATRTTATLTYRPVLLGAIYRATAAPHGASGSASDVFNAAKKAVTQHAMARTLKRYNVAYAAPPLHPRKSVDVLRLLYCVRDQAERCVLTHALFRAYWVEGRDVADRAVLMRVLAESGIRSAETLTVACFDEDVRARKELEAATAEAIQRGAFGVPGFWIPEARWVDGEGEGRVGRFFWGQDRMHFVEATLLSLAADGISSSSSSFSSSFPSSSSSFPSPSSSSVPKWSTIPHLRSLLPRAIPTNTFLYPTKLEFWFDFSSPWAYLGYTQLARLQRTFPTLVIELKPFLLGILFREIGAPNMPMLAVSRAKAAWSRQDHADWTAWWNAVNEQEGARGDAKIDFKWADKFPIRTPTVLRVGIVEPRCVGLLFSACWSQNLDVASDIVLQSVLDTGGYDGADLIAKANFPAVKNTLRHLTNEAKEMGLCGVPTYRVLRRNQSGDWDLAGGLVWGQDEMGVVEDLIAGWDVESGPEVAESRKVNYEARKGGARL